jgi:serine/threonine protein kinase
MLAKFASKLENCYHEGKVTKKIKFGCSLKAELEFFQKEIDNWNERLSRRLLLRGVVLTLNAHAPATSVKEITQTTLNLPQIPCFPIGDLPRLESLKSLDNSKVFYGQLSDETPVLIEYRGSSLDLTFKEKMFVKYSVRDVASILYGLRARARDPGRSVPKGILECMGYFSDESSSRFGLISKLPPSYSKSSLHSLQSLLWDPQNKRGSRHDLNDRIVLASAIASTILEIHSTKFVHKNIRPSNILILDPPPNGSDCVPGYPHVIGRPAIVGFEDARPEAEDSERIGSAAWVENIYRHPKRQGLNPEAKYSMLDDIYSLGIVFIEIALWRSSVILATNNASKLVSASHNPDFWGSLHSTRCKETDPEKIRSLYRKLAKAVVPRTIGGKFARVIDNCLTCLDEGIDEGLDDEEAGEVGTNQVDVAFLQRIVESLEGLSF